MPVKTLFFQLGKDLTKTPKVLFKKLKKKLMHHLDLKVKIYMDWMEVVMMLDLMFLEDPNKLSQLINFKNTLMNQKPKFRRMLHPEFLEFQEFQKLHHKLCLLQNLKLLKLNQLQKIIQPTRKEMEIRMPRQWQVQLLKLFLLLHHTQLLKFFRTNTNNF